MNLRQRNLERLPECGHGKEQQASGKTRGGRNQSTFSHGILLGDDWNNFIRLAGNDDRQ